MSLKLRIEGTGTTTNYHFAASGPVAGTRDTEMNDDTPEHEAHGQIVDGVDTYEFSGIPTNFYCDDDANAWTLDLALDMGAGFVEQTPEDLNAGIIEVRGQGHYRLEIPEPGMILRGEKADERDGVLTGPNTVVAGNVTDGGIDSWRAWPVEAVAGKIDQDGEYRIVNNEAGGGWHDLETIRTSMTEF